MQFNRIMNVKPGSMDKVMQMAQKFPERAKEVLGDDYAGPCLLYTSPSPRDRTRSRMPSSA